MSKDGPRRRSGSPNCLDLRASKTGALRADDLISMLPVFFLNGPWNVISRFDRILCSSPSSPGNKSDSHTINLWLLRTPGFGNTALKWKESALASEKD